MIETILGTVFVVGRYPVGNRVQVHYDPRHPRHTVLAPGMSGKTLKLILITCALLVVMLTLGLALLLGFLTQAGE